MTDILMPALSPTMEEGSLTKWHIKPGDDVSAGQVIAEIETDKATMEVEAVDEGVVEEILVPEGTEAVKVNTAIARLSGGSGAAAPSAPAPVQAAPPVVPSPKAAPSAPSAPASPVPATPIAASGQRIFASPLARRIARDKGLDLAAVKGTGPHGRIIRRDVEALSASPATRPAAARPSVEPRAVQSLDQQGIPLSDRIYFDTEADCARNLVIVQFQQVR